MKTNKQSKVKVPKSGFRRSRFNWNHDVNTTFSWGEIQPTQCKLLIPNSKTTMSAQSLIRLAPMVAPTFGRVKYKTYNQFVALSEIFPNFDALMAQEPVSTAAGTQVPQALPSVTLGRLSSWCLQGARATAYFAVAGTYNGTTMTAQQAAGAGYYTTFYRDTPMSAMNQNFQSHMNNLTSGGLISASPASDAFNATANQVLPEVNGITLTLGNFGPNYNAVFGTTTPVVLGSKNIADLCPVVRSFEGNGVAQYQDYQREVTMEGADLVLEGSYQVPNSQTIEYFAIALEFSDYGKRLRKFIQGLGYQVNLTSQAKVSILPLLATYKAYFDIFGLELYQGWETTYCARIIKSIENNFLTDMDSMFIRDGKAALATIDNSNLGVAFMMTEAANMWYTDDADYVSAHLSKLAVSPMIDKQGFVNYDIQGLDDYLHMDATATDKVTAGGSYVTGSQGDWSNSGVPISLAGGDERVGGHMVINQTQHSQIDAEMLKRLYKWTNRNTILGRRIAEILRAQGLGRYVDECKSNYIGSTDTIVTISDVVSTAATADASLGEYGGKGLQYTNDKTLVFENDSYGYWITLATCVPEAGYTQGLDPTLTALDKINLYNPDFDAVGMEATPKQNIIATNYIPGSSENGAEIFGFIPRYSRFKVAQNLTNGDFNRHSKRNTYLPYTLDKQLNVNDFDVRNTGYNESNKIGQAMVERSVRTNAMPLAGNVWRYPTKYNWLGNFDRIFLRTGQRDDYDIRAVASLYDVAVGWTDYNDDNFLCHSIYDVQCYAPMKPIEDSYGLDEDDPMRAGDEFVSKA